MPQRLSIAKLITAGVQTQSLPRFKSALLKSAARWPEQLTYLRQLYSKVDSLWSVDGPDGPLYDEASPKVHELLLGLNKVSEEIADRPDLFRIVRNAQNDFATAKAHAVRHDIASAVQFLSYSLMRISSVLDGLTQLANGGKHVDAAGYDISGEVFEPGEQESRSPNLWDQGNSPKLDRTPANPANQLVDSDAENDFPELKEEKHQRVDWPARSR